MKLQDGLQGLGCKIRVESVLLRITIPRASLRRVQCLDVVIRTRLCMPGEPKHIYSANELQMHVPRSSNEGCRFRLHTYISCFMTSAESCTADLLEDFAFNP